jgi:hypothetical protein
MTTRRIIIAILAACAMTATGRAATVRTTNFIVETARQDDAEEFAKLAEYYRKQKALDWLGREMPKWSEPCRLRIHITGNGAGGATTFDFEGGQVFQEMQIEGSRERLKNSVLPHEVTHTVFAHHFRQPVPRWADEGGSVYSEDDIERSRHDKLCKQILNSGDGIQLKALFRMKNYPKNVMTLYAQGYSVSKYLVEQSDRQTFLNFVAAGMQKNNNNWDAACQEFYSFKNVDDLEKNWIEHLKKVARGEVPTSETASTGRRPAPPGADGKLVVFDSSPPSRPNFDPPPAARGVAPASGSSDRFGGDIGWNRPRARLAEPVSAESPSRPDPKPVAAPAPRAPSAILLPPEPAPQR